MSYIQLDHIAYTYPSGLAPVFEDLTLHLDTDWKLGIIGRNGMGKSTFFKLLAGEITGEGRISAERSFLRFPLPDPDETIGGYDFSAKYLDESSQWKVLREAHLLGLSEEIPAEECVGVALFIQHADDLLCFHSLKLRNSLRHIRQIQRGIAFPPIWNRSQVRAVRLQKHPLQRQHFHHLL